MSMTLLRTLSIRPLRKAARAAALTSVLFAGACAFTPPQDAPQVAQPKTLPQRNVTGFTEALTCMDDLFLAFGKNNIIITSQGLPDATGEISTGTKEMLISAISRMSVKSGAFRFVDFDQQQFDVNALQQLVGFTDQFVVPNYYIRGAISQFDEGVVSEAAGGSVALSDFDLGISGDQVISVVAVDLNVGDLLSRQIIPGLSANNIISVRRNGLSGDAGGRINKAGLAFNLTFNNTEGLHSAVRSLIELSAIETMGKLTQVPYWRCLQIEQTNPEVVAEARDWFGAMGERERVTFTQRALGGLGLYDGRPDGVMNASLREAIGSYQASSGLLASGRIDFDLYQSLIAGDLALGREPGTESPPARLEVASARPERLLELAVTTVRGANPKYRVGEKLQVQLRPTTDAYAYCFYRDGAGSIARIFPNRFQPDARIAGGGFSAVPGPGVPFDILFERAGVTEEVACIAAREPVSSTRSRFLAAQDLTPLPAGSLDEVMASFRTLDGVHVTEARLRASVEP
ncbi:MAG: DUF4384 domain-containing protein [Geminicoccaceae bacterium]